MGKIPESTAKPEPKALPKAEAKKEAPKKKLDCFVMPDKPAKPGLVIISTSKVQDGCYVLGWQEQSTTMLVSEGRQWYDFSSRLLKVNLVFVCAFAMALLIVIWLSRRVR